MGGVFPLCQLLCGKGRTVVHLRKIIKRMNAAGGLAFASLVVSWLAMPGECLAETAGVSSVSIAVPRAAAKSTRLAADEFAKYWELVTGIRPPIVEDAASCSAPVVRIGFPASADVFDGKTDAYLLKSTADGLEVAGKNARSLFYAVYDFFERRCGCRWFWDGDVVPKASKVDI